MSSRFEIAPSWVVELMEEVRKEYFRGYLAWVRIAVLWDTKRREKGGQLVVGRIKKAGDVEKLLAEGHLVPADDIDGLTYMMFLDKAIFEALEKMDRVRIIRHELRHIWIEITDTGKVQYKIREHDIQDFQAEVDLNGADPDWRKRVAMVSLAVYDEKGKPIPGPDPNQGDLFAAGKVSVTVGSEIIVCEHCGKGGVISPDGQFPEGWDTIPYNEDGDTHLYCPDCLKSAQEAGALEPVEPAETPDRSETYNLRLKAAVLNAVNLGMMVDGYPDPETVRSVFGVESGHPDPAEAEILAMFEQVRGELGERKEMVA